MDTALLKRQSEFEWQLPQHDQMRVPGIIFASEELIRDMDNKVYEQVKNVASLPGIQAISRLLFTNAQPRPLQALSLRDWLMSGKRKLG